MRKLKTEKCIICGKQAINWRGHVLAREKMAFGNSITVKIVAGFCNEHTELLESDDNGCFGKYEPEIMGLCIPLKF